MSWKRNHFFSLNFLMARSGPTKVEEKNGLAALRLVRHLFVFFLLRRKLHFIQCCCRRRQTAFSFLCFVAEWLVCLFVFSLWRSHWRCSAHNPPKSKTTNQLIHQLSAGTAANNSFRNELMGWTVPLGGWLRKFKSNQFIFSHSQREKKID